MMRQHLLPLILIVLLVLSASCRRKLSEEQRREMQEARKEQEITRITDQEIVQEALEKGRLFRELLENGKPTDSLGSRYEAEVSVYRSPDEMTDLERELWEAYQAGWENGATLDDNVQRDYPDHLYYTYPLIQMDSLTGMVSIKLSRKQLILNY